MNKKFDPIKKFEKFKNLTCFSVNNETEKFHGTGLVIRKSKKFFNVDFISSKVKDERWAAAKYACKFVEHFTKKLRQSFRLSSNQSYEARFVKYVLQKNEKMALCTANM